MGQHEEWAEPSRLLPNGLLPNAAPMIRVLDSERWLKAEERTAELISCIQPTRPSEQRRNAVADYVQRLIMKCFPCQGAKVFTFGSMPLKTYLPDGDIDLTAFSNNPNLKDTWAYQVRDMLEKEEKNDNAEFHVKEVQYIQAEVKIIKCLVENIVVDISFNQLGGLCTLCFLEEVDHLINHNHLFKRSIILIKAWCYYESRILGAHHGLISTYALETLVLYIFHVFNNTFTGPLEVLYRFLEFFSNFDWDNFCVSLWGPVPIRSLPDVIVEPPRKDNGELLLKKLFLDACNSVYAVNPGVQENQGPPFVSKHFNVIDPLRVNNNLGRSVSKGNFFRIRSAFSFGAKKLERLLDCAKENLIYEVNQFFMNTWDRHGNGCRPDAPRADLSCLKLSDLHHQPQNEILSVSTISRKVNESGHDVKTEGTHSHVSSHPGNHFSGSMSKQNDYSNYTQNRKTHRNSNTSRVSDHSTREATCQNVLSDVCHRNSTSDNLVKDIESRFLFARTRSSPELTDTYGDTSSSLRRTRVQGSAKMHPALTRQENSNRRKNPGSENMINHNIRSLHDDTSSVRQNQSHQNNDTVTDSNNGLNSYFRDFGLDTMNEELSSTSRTQDMLQEEQDLVNLMASLHGFNGQVHLPFNLVSAQLPFPISPSFLTSIGYTERSIPGLVPTNIPMIDPAYSDVQFQHGIISPHLTHYFPGIGLSPTSQDTIDYNNENFSSMDSNSGEAEHGFWREQDAGSTCGFGTSNGNFEGLQAEDKPHSTHSGLTVDPSWVSGTNNSLRAQQNHTKEKRGLMREEHSTNCQFQDNRTNDVYVEERLASSRFSSTAHSSPLRKSSSESSWDGSSTKSSKSARERRGKKTVIVESTNGYGKGKVMSEPVPCQNEDDNQEWNSMSTELAERGQGSLSVVSLHVPRHHVPGYEVAHTSGSESIIPIAPMLIGTGSRQRMTDNSGVIAFYPTGPPVPFVTMLPFCNIPPEAGTPDTSECHFGGEDSIDNSDSSHNVASFEGLDYSEDLNPSHSLRGAASVLASDEQKSDILHSDFASHWQNLQYGRFCQNTRYHGPLVYPSPVMVHPTFMQGHFPWDGPGRPISENMNLFTQLMSYSPRLVPVAPIQSISNRPTNMFQRYVDDMPRYRSGTGTYLPNHPKVTARDRHSSGTRRGNYNYERNDNHGDRDGNWKGSSKTRASGHSHNRSQTEKSNSRLDWLSSKESRADRSWGSHRNDTFASYQSQCANSDISSVPDVAYGMYPLTAMNPTGVSSNGPTVPPVVMLYPFDNPSYCSLGEQLEFGSLGPLGVSGLSEQPQLGEGSRPRGAFDECRFHVQRSSPDQPSSPLHQRRI